MIDLKKHTYKLIMIAFFLLLCSCNDTEHQKPALETLNLVSSIPANNDNEVSFRESQVSFIFSENIKLNQPQNIEINGELAQRVTVNMSELRIDVSLQPNTTYIIEIPKNQITGRESGAMSGKIEIVFKTQDVELSKLVIDNPSIQTQKLYNYLKSITGEKMITGTMANVSWNINEAEWVRYHTGEYPALNCFDYIHLYASPSSWIDYENISVIENWWQNNGLVAAMWHWNVPKSNSNNSYAFYSKETDFDVSRAVIKGTDEYDIVIADLNKIADNLLLLNDKNIPILWRPLHEASGRWFWWGAKGAMPAKKLWQMMFDVFNDKGLNNLIWIWTSDGNDDEWYPGDDYVDLIGADIYDKDLGSIVSFYENMKRKYPNKMLALSEYGNISNLSEQWAKNVKWLWAMPWYDYERTLTIEGLEFKKESHQFANKSYWQNIFEMKDIIVYRNNVPNLK